MNYTKLIKGHILEYYDDEHQYLVDGVMVSSITQLLTKKFPKRYEGIRKEVLEKAAEKGTEMHQDIENYCVSGVEKATKEIRNFKFLMKAYDFFVIDNEVPVILFKDEKPIAAGRLDMIIKINDAIGIADLKRTSTLDKEYLAYQLNLYRIAFQQCYGIPVKNLHGIQLKDDKRKMVEIPINEYLMEEIWDLIQ